MAKWHTEWTVLAHQRIEKLEDNLWHVAGAIPNMPFTRHMTLVKLADGRVLMHGAICLEDEAMAEIEAWGEPSILLVPNGWHRLDVPAFAARYPGLQIFCPTGSRKKVEEAVPVVGSYDDLDVGSEVQLQHLRGVADAEGVMRVRSAGGTTLVFNDALFNINAGKGPRWWMVRLMGSAGGPKVTRLGKMTLVKDKAALREHLQALANLEGLTRLIPGHGDVIDRDASAVLKRVAAAL
jgi:hypothetical protein